MSSEAGCFKPLRGIFEADGPLKNTFLFEEVYLPPPVVGVARTLKK